MTADEPAVAAVVISWDDPDATRRAVESLRSQTVPLQEIVVVDNHPTHPARAAVGELARVIPSANLGFAGGVEVGMRTTDAAWVFLLNPDAVAKRDCVERLLEAVDDQSGVIGAQVLLPDGRINAGDNPVHLSGITWAGHFHEPPDVGPPRGVASVSGAAMLVCRTAYDAVGGIAADFFMYHEDVELSWRMRLSGWDVVFQPAAHVTHDYEFDKGTRKWFLLERNRARTVLTCYSGRALALLAPLLVATEVAVVTQARRDGWGPEKRRALKATWRDRHLTAARRRHVQAHRVVPDAELVARMTATFDTPLMRIPQVPTINRLMEAYRRFLMRALR